MLFEQYRANIRVRRRCLGLVKQSWLQGCTLKNGAIIYSDFATVYAIRTESFLLYPNPVSSGQTLTIRSSEPGVYVFHLVDAMGRVIQAYPLSGTTGKVSTAGLSTGIYFYAVYSDGTYAQTGRLVIK